jgi:hypothetical protein
VHSVARPKADPVVAESHALARIAELAASIANTLRQPGRSRYSSERHLREWLTDDGIQFTVADIAPALGLLEATGRLIRRNVERGLPRSGWLPEHAPEATEDIAGPGAENSTKDAPETVEATPETVPDPPDTILRNCLVCGRGLALDDEGRIGEHFDRFTTCPGSVHASLITAIASVSRPLPAHSRPGCGHRSPS